MPSNNTIIYKPAVRSAWGSAADSTALVDPETATPGFTAAGWPLSAQPPARQYWNWILNYCMNGVRYFCRRGIVDWDTAETYWQTDVVQYGGVVYQSLQSNNSGNAPASSPAFWGGLQGYVLTGQLNNYVTNAQLASTLTNYVTNPALSAALANYATLTNLANTASTTLGQAEAYTNSALANYVTNGALSADLANYWPASYISANFYTAGAVNSILGSYYTANQVNSALSSYVPISAYNAEIAALTAAIAYASDTVHYTLPGGLQIRWGSQAIGSGALITPGFPSAIYGAVATAYVNDGHASIRYYSGASFYVTSDSGNVTWIAVGK